MADILDENGESIWDQFGSFLTDEQALSESPWGNTITFSGIVVEEELSGIVVHSS